MKPSCASHEPPAFQPALRRLERWGRLMAVAVLLLPSAPAPDASAQTAPGERILHVGTSGDYAPFSTLNKPAPGSDASAPGSSSYSGFDIEVARRFAIDRGYRVEFVPFMWPDLARDLEGGRFDVAMSGVTMRGDRSVIGRFTLPVAATQAVALSWKGAQATVVQQLDRRNRRIAVNAGGYLEGVARRVFPSAQIIALTNNDAVRMALLDRWTDAVVSDNLEERQWTKGARDVVRIGPLSDDRKAYLFRVDRQEIAIEMDTWLAARERDGSLARLREDLLGQTTATPVAAPLPALITAIVERMSMMPLVWAAKHHAGLPIADEAQEARVLDAAVSAVVAAANAASRPPADSARIRVFFKALIESGKDVQRQLAEQRRALLQRNKRRNDAAGQAGADATTPEPASSADVPTPPLTIPLFNLETQIRPAIARVTVKIARLLIALDAPLTSEQVQRQLAAALSDYRAKPGHLEAMSKSIASLSAR